jgi:peroxiredoxin
MRFWRLILALAAGLAILTGCSSYEKQSAGMYGAWGQLTLELQDDLDQTVRDIQTLWKAKETDIDAYRLLLGRLDMLEEHAAEMPPSFQEEILRYRSNTYLRTKQFEEAVVGFQRMVDEFPDAKELKYRQNMVKGLESRLDLAKQALGEELNETNKAIRSLWKANEGNPSAYSEYLETLARLEAEADQMPPRFLERILDLRANTYGRTGRPGEAIRDYQRMIDLFPESKYTQNRKKKIGKIEALMAKEKGSGPLSQEVAEANATDDTQVGSYEEYPSEAMGVIMAEVWALLKEGKAQPDDFKQYLDELDTLYHRTHPDNRDDRGGILFSKSMVMINAMNDIEAGKTVFVQIMQEYDGTWAAGQVGLVIEKFKLRRALEGEGELPNFTFTDLKGRPISLEDYRGKVVLIDFWATWCGPCIYELPNVKSAYRKYHDNGFEIIGISLDTDRNKLMNFIEEENMGWPQYFDGLGWSNKLSTRFGIRSIPATLLIGPDGSVIGKNLRGTSLKSAVRKAVKKL